MTFRSHGPEVGLVLAREGEGVRPDLVGWRRDCVPSLPQPGPGGAVTERPDWIAEGDLGDKLTIYHAAEVPHYWIIDPQNRTLLVYRRLPEGYVVVLGAGSDKTVCVEPFDALEIRVGLLFGDEEEAAEGEPVR